MMPKGLFKEIIMIALAVGIVATYIRPTFADITKTQEDILLYQTERTKITEVNDSLDGLTKTLESVEMSDKNKLFTYLPDQVDSVAIPRTLSFMAEDAGLILVDVSYDGVREESLSEESESGPIPHDISMNVEGSYSQIKRLVSMLERNEYPLEIHSLDISVLEGGFLSAKFEIVTYSQYLPSISILDSLNIGE